MATDLQISDYSWLPDPVGNSARTEFTIRATNNGPSTIADAVVTIAVSPGFSVAAGDIPSYCTLSGAVGAQHITCNLPAMAIGDQSIVYHATAIVIGSANSTATISSVSAGDTHSANDNLTVTPAVRAGADLSVVKDDDLPGHTIPAGGTIAYKIHVTNAGPNAAGAIRLTDNLPPSTDFEYISASGTSWSCTRSGVTVTCNYTGAAMIGALPVITVTGRVIRQSSGTITNNAFATLTDPLTLDPDGENNAAPPVVTTILEGSDLRAGKTMPGVIVQGDGAVLVSLTIFNDGPQTVTGATISDTFAAHFTLGAMPAGCTASGQTVTCEGGTLTSGQSRNFLVPVTPNAPTGGNVVNSATITPPAGHNDPNIANNSASATYSIVAPSADLSLTKSKTPNPVAAGSNMTSTIMVRNNGPAVLSYSPTAPLRVTDNVSPDETYVSADPAWTCAQTGSEIRCETVGTGTIPVNATLPLSLITQAGPSANAGLTNTACTGTTGGSGATPSDGNAVNDCVNATARATTVTTDIAVVKEVSLSPSGPWTQTPALMIPATASSFYIRLTASNPGTAPAGSVTVTDMLPNLLNAGGFTTGFGAVSVSSGNTAYTAATGRIDWTLSNLGAGVSETAVVRIDRPMNSGTFDNKAVISSSDTIDSNSANNESTARYTVEALADMQVTAKSISPNPAQVGVIATYTISVRNNGANPASSVVVTDTIDPARFELVGNPVSTKTGSVCSGTPATGEIGCTMGTFARGEAFQVTQQVRPRFPFGGATSGFPIAHTNSAAVTTVTAESNTANNSFSVTHSVTGPSFDLAVVKTEPSAAYDPIRFGDELVYDLRVSNFGPSRASNVVITDIPQPPAGYTMALAGFTVNPVAATGGLTLYTPPSPMCATVGAQIECRLHGGSAEANYLDSLRQVVFRLRFTIGGAAPLGPLTVTNTAEVIALEQNNVTTSQADAQLTNNKSVQTTTVLPSADLEVVSKTRTSAATAGINEPIAYDIVIRNNGESPIAQVRVTDTLPAGFVLANPAPAAVATGAATLSAITCTGTTSVLCILDGHFPPDGSPVTVTLYARAAYPYSGPLNTSMTNTVSIAPGQDAGGQDLARDGNAANNSKTATVQIAQSSIAGTVFGDANLDNVVQAGEGIASVTLTLSGTDAYGNAIAPRTMTSNASGAFLFDRLPAGTYQIVETQPAGYLDYRETAGTAGGTVNNASFGNTAPTNGITGIALPASTAATGYLFAERPAASIAGTVWRDVNNNGVIDAGETGVGPADFPSGPQIGLTGTDHTGAAISLTTSVDANGHYIFSDLPPSDAAGYTVTQLVQPNGLADGLDTNGAGLVVAGSAGRIAPEAILVGTLSAGQALTNRNFGELPTSTLSGMVFLDPNGNATRDAGENSGLAGAIVRLTGTNDLGAAIDCTLTTDATGAYSFPEAAAADPACRVLRPGTYALAVTPAPGLEHSGAYIGSAGGASGGVTGPNAAAPGDANRTVTNIVITAGTTATHYDFGATGQGLSGSVYLDRDGNGARNAGETGIPGVAVTLSGTTAGGQDVCTLIACAATTDAAGNYIFTGVPGSSPAGYTLTQQPQSSAPLSAYADGTDAAGTVNGATRGTAGNDVISGIVLNAGELGTDYAFGEIGGSLAGTAYIDGNGDGTRQPGETGIAGVLVTLSGTIAGGQDICALRAALNPALPCTATTGADGGYRFDDLPAGSYTLTETQPAAYADGRESAGTPGGTVNNASFSGSPAENRIAAIALGNGAQGSGYDFGEQATVIAGRVYKDRERDGVDSGGEPGIGGVTITLSQGGTVIATTVTGPDGSYRFENLPAGSYTVTETQPDGYGSSTPDSHSVTVSAGVTQTIDFGETLSTLAGSVFVDSNDDGARQSGERGLEGVTIRLTGTDAAGHPVDVTVTTDASGGYLFDDLLAGTYVLTETQPAGYGDGKDAAGSAGGTVGNDMISAIAIPTGTDATGYAFGERGQAQGGTVYVDSDRNGAQGLGEPGIPGVVVELRRPDGTVVQSVTTGPDGHYAFADIEAGDYVIVEQQPLGYADAPENRANRAPLTVGVGAPVTPVNFGEQVGSLAGSVYNDTNGNGRRDADEPAIPGVALTLTGSDARGNAVTQTVTSGPDGSYRFIDLPGGSYQIVEMQPAGYDDGLDTPGTAGGVAAGDTIGGIALGAGQDAIGYLFSERGQGARVAGHVWSDHDHDRVRDSGEPVHAGWIVELRLGDVLIASTTTDAEGGYAFTGVAPGSGYQILFRNPANNAVFGSARPNESGAAITEGVVSPANPAGARTADGSLRDMTLAPGANTLEQSLPLDPSGVVYDSVRRAVIEGATVRISGPAGFDPARHLLGGAANAAQVTGADGMYQFLLMPDAPAGLYTLAVTPPDGRYNPVQPSSIIAPCAGPLAVGRTPDPMLISSYASAPPASAIAACTPGGETTAYYLGFTLTPGLSANVVNNNLPLDPVLEGAIAVTKTTPMVNTSRGGLVPYTITAKNMLAGALTGITITDRTPAGFRYREGSATIDGVPAEPQQAGRLLSWPGQAFTAGEEKTVKIVLTVGAGVGEGEHVNQAFAINSYVDAIVSNIADASVRITPDPDFDCTDILGKVFDDRNMNGTQEEGEPGLPGVRLATVNGLLVTTDADGRYHITCPMIPNEDRGSNFILKLDTRTLPTGYRVTTGNPETVRLTRGKFAKLNFGAALGRVVRVAITADAFDHEGVAEAFLPDVDALVATLAEGPSVLRIAYGLAPGEDRATAGKRIRALREMIEERWQQDRDRYRLIVEEEIAVRTTEPKGGVQ